MSFCARLWLSDNVFLRAPVAVGQCPCCSCQTVLRAQGGTGFVGWTGNHTGPQPGYPDWARYGASVQTQSSLSRSTRNASGWLPFIELSTGRVRPRKNTSARTDREGARPAAVDGSGWGRGDATLNLAARLHPALPLLGLLAVEQHDRAALLGARPGRHDRQRAEDGREHVPAVCLAAPGPRGVRSNPGLHAYRVG